MLDFANISSKNKILFEIDDVLVAKSTMCDMTNAGPMVGLLNFIAAQYFVDCMTVILYDEFFFKSLTFQPVIMLLLRMFPGIMLHGQFSTSDVPTYTNNTSPMLTSQEIICRHYIVLSHTLESAVELLGFQPNSKVVLVSQASQWQINNFLQSPAADQLFNLLVLEDPSLQVNFISEKEDLKTDINLYTHKLYADPMGMKVPWLLTAWRCDHLTQPHVNLFPTKINNLNGYQLRVVASQQPPYVYQTYIQDTEGDIVSQWDGLEIRLLHLISAELNFTPKFQRPDQTSLSNPMQRVLLDLSDNKGDIGAAGVYLNEGRLLHFRFSTVHSHDCTVFMTLASTALPKYRAILGPFRWEVWMTITLAYLFAILPISFSAHHTLSPLLDDPSQIENMFWYVFGTFTNCFTFTGRQSWTNAKLSSTRMFIGTYWAFSIIVSAAYTGSIIAFIMLPKFPQVVQTVEQLIENNYRLITTNITDLKESIYNSSDASVLHLSRSTKVVDSVEEAVSNVVNSPFFIDYAFLHSREFLKHIIKTNSSTKVTHKKTVFHLTSNCFVPMLITLVFPPKSTLVERINSLIMRASQAGLVNKLLYDVAWDQQKLDSGKLLQVSAGGLRPQAPDERQLTLEDTQGMFLLLGAGFTMAAVALVLEFTFNKLKTAQLHVPSTEYSEDENIFERGNYQFRNKDDFLQFFGRLQDYDQKIQVRMNDLQLKNRITSSLVIENVQYPTDNGRSFSA